MFKKFGAAGLMLGIGLLFVQPSAVNAQDWYGRDGHSYRYDKDRDRDYRRYERQRIREEREARKWREKEYRDRERRDFRNYSNGYRNDRYPAYGYGDRYRPY
jgi:hypothetical protein